MPTLTLTLADYARFDRDGTFTILRGGVGRVIVDRFPQEISLTAFGEVGGFAAGDYPATLTLDGVRLEGGMVIVRSTARPTRFLIPAVIQATSPGSYIVQLQVGSLVAQAPLVIQAETST